MISIIIVTWNNEAVIGNCIKSIFRFEKEVDFEIIIVDNASTDNTLEEVRKLDFSNIKILEAKKNLGFAKANNRGAQLASGDRLLFLNPDTIFIQKGLNKVFEFIQEDIGIVGCKLLNEDLTLQASCFNFDSPKNIILEQFMIGKLLPEKFRKKCTPYLGKHDEQSTVDWVVGAFVATTKKNFQAIQGWSEDFFLYSEDMELAYKMKKYLHRSVLFLPHYKIVHLGGQSEIQDYSQSKHIKLLESRLQFYKKYSLKSSYKTLLNCYKLKCFCINTMCHFFYQKKLFVQLEKYKEARKFLLEKKEKL